MLKKFIIAAVVIVGLPLFFISRNGGVPQIPLSEESKEKDEISIIFVGDIMLSREVGRIMERKGVNFPFEMVQLVESRIHPIMEKKRK